MRPIGFIPQRGFSLFEVLITVVVISIGLLGLAALQFAGLRAANSAQEHTQATLLAQDVAERIHANATRSYDGIDLTGSSSVTTVVCDSGHFCDPTSLRLHDIAQWKKMIDQPLLANLRVMINHHGANPDDYYTVTLTWGNSDNQQTLQTSFKQ